MSGVRRTVLRLSQKAITMKEINSFDGEYKFLSNFFIFPLIWEGLLYPASENAYQAMKTEDEEVRVQFMHITPDKAKRKGRQIKMRDGWDEMKIDVMRDILTEKFKDKVLRKKLLDTGSAELVEGNWWGDEYWGRCDGKGQNWLGILLMDVREHYQNESSSGTGKKRNKS
jgi:ribA/ribD-fused uncharacterized protein